MIRPLTEEDVTETYLEWMNDPLVTRYLEARFQTHTMEDLRRFVASNPVWGIFVDGVHVGNIKLDTNAHHKRGDIGLLIGAEYWGKGHATDAINAMTEHAFSSGLHKVTAGAYAGNGGSVRAFEKAGFSREGVLKEHWYVDGEYQDGILMGKIKAS